MGSLEEEEKLAQMVHDFIESETPTPISISSSKILSLHQSNCLALEGIVGSVTKAEMEVYERVLEYMREMGNNRKSSSVKKRLMMKLRKDGYDASLFRSSWVTTMDCPGGDYEYIDIVMEDVNGDSVRLIVDVHFRSQFELARPTLAYSQLSNTLPSIFVGSEDKLNKIISLLCPAAKQSLKESGLHIPPWRKASYMQSKWLSCSHQVPTIAFPKYSRDGARDSEAKTVGSPNSSKLANWPPLKIKPKRRELGDGFQGSGLSSQFSNFSINCC